MNGQYLFVQEEGNVLTVAFADKPDEPSTYLLLQRSLLPSEQDKLLGQDKVYIELNEQKHSAYGGVERIELEGNQLLLALNSETALKLGSERNLKVIVNVNEISNICKHLNDIFEQIIGDRPRIKLNNND